MKTDYTPVLKEKKMLSKGVFSLFSYTFLSSPYARSNNPRDCCIVILEAAYLF